MSATAAPRYMAGNCLWTAEGSVLAVWRLNGLNHARMSDAARMSWFGACKSAMIALPGSWTTIEAATPVDPNEVMAAMVDGVDIEANPAWAAQVLDSVDGLEAARLFRRESFLLAEIPGVQRGWLAGLRGFADHFSKVPPPPKRE